MAKREVKEDVDMWDLAESVFSQIQGSGLHQKLINQSPQTDHISVNPKVKEEAYIKEEQEQCIKQEKEELSDFPVTIIKTEDGEDQNYLPCQSRTEEPCCYSVPINKNKCLAGSDEVKTEEYKRSGKKCAEKRKHTADEVLKELRRRDSDFSDEDFSDEASIISSVDSVAENMLIEEGDVILVNIRQTADSDTEWEPDCSVAEDAVLDKPTTDLNTESQLGFSTAARGRSRKAMWGQDTTTRLTRTPTAPAEERWFGVNDPDVTPHQPTFRPSQKPGCQLKTTANYSVLELFQLFFSKSVLCTILKKTNENGRANCTWTDISLQDMFSFLSIVVYTSFVKCSALLDYWRKGSLYNLPYPQQVISSNKFLAMRHALHFCSGRGTTALDRLGIIKPLYDEIRKTCRQNYHPGQNISINERMVTSSSKFFVLTDSESGYIWDFVISEGKRREIGDEGLSYNSLISLVNTSLLGTGYKLFVGNFDTSPTLFHSLLQKKIWACGSIKTNKEGCPKTESNALDQTSSSGSIRWLRTGSLLFVHWRDTRNLFLCSTIHSANGTETVNRKMKNNKGQVTVKNVPVPPAVKDYRQQFVGPVTLSEPLITYDHVLCKTRKWYKAAFYHIIDIAIANAFILHQKICEAKGQVPFHPKAFRETLALELSQVGSHRSTPEQPPEPRDAHHRLVYISDHSTMGRQKCRRCHAKTPVKCATCDKPLCFVPYRDCYNQWHVENNM